MNDKTRQELIDRGFGIFIDNEPSITQVIESIKIIKKFNKLPVKVVSEMITEYNRTMFDDKFLKDWEFTGLNNKDFLELHVEIKEGNK